MAVPCSGCGREYDVTLFEFGRTLWCACGRRVGAERRERSLGAPGETRFVADAMLGRLARWLRLLGFDCAWEPDVSDRDLVRRGVEEQRVILTRDRALADEWRVSGIQTLRAERTGEQLRELLGRLDLADSVRLFSRCSACNEPLAEVAPESVRGRVPDRVFAQQEAFRGCPRCGRIYWEGSHTARVRRVAEGLLGRGGRAEFDIMTS